MHIAALDDGRVLGTLMRTRESFFDSAPPSAYGPDEADVLAQLGEKLSALIATREDELDRYLWDEEFATRSVALDIHPASAVRKQPVIGKRVVPLRLTFAWSKTKGGAYRVMLPRFRWWLPASDANSSERLRDYPQQYEFSVVTNFNAGQVRHRGGAIFLHVNGSGATAGCVSAPRWFLLKAMNRLDQDRVPVIAIGR